MDIFIGSSQNWSIFRGNFYGFFCFALLILQILVLVLEIPDIFFG